MRELNLFVIAFLASLTANAKFKSRSCLVTDYILISKEIHSIENCVIIKDLELSRAGRFANWHGRIERPYQETETYEKIISNRCAHTVESRTNEIRIRNRSIVFLMPSPIVEPGAPSYQRTPYADSEAQSIFDDLLMECQKTNPTEK